MFGNDWDDVLQEELEQPYFQELMAWLNHEYAEHMVFPPRPFLFQAFQLTPFHQVKAVIVGQDPYHKLGQSHGLSFSVLPGVRIPPSLHNIYKEMSADLNIPVPLTGTLTPWAEEGVLLLNSILTVREGIPNSHQGKGWERFTDAVISKLNEGPQPLVFMLWGNYARRKGAIIDARRHEIIASAHPSPLSARHGFFGSRPFSRCNAFLSSHGRSPIDWRIPENDF
ncbi:uracil-DNA glycosylase [Paenibacillus physcomitrellae]|uniref:Uracil-DNA glycosylase n=1 Tax=Paenibacillus physcomitrellae TaxID=1619311 RepID=A0ABQ1FLG6_9BACL|nr:uracil-DNA glycosylase [Paenibacillus physcomitrellae]GGA21328.1 uracil-DNA glycosylase [Paenibacillus physcomitrellae]